VKRNGDRIQNTLKRLGRLTKKNDKRKEETLWGSTQEKGEKKEQWTIRYSRMKNTI